MTNNYSRIAQEYYSDKHITSRNFDIATRDYFKNNSVTIPEKGLIIEFGAGKGRSNEYCNIDPDRLVQTDISEEMLSLEPRGESFLKVISDACNTPFLDKSFSVATAFLFDPFNVHNFYKELARLLNGGGVFIGTLPHFKWGSTLRQTIKYSQTKTKFLTLKGEFLEFDSYLSTDSQIQKNFKEMDFDVIIKDIYLPKTVTKISPHIEIPAKELGLSPFEIPILQYIFAKKGGVA